MGKRLQDNRIVDRFMLVFVATTLVSFGYSAAGVASDISANKPVSYAQYTGIEPAAK